MNTNFSSSLPPAAVPPTNAPSPTVVDDEQRQLQVSFRANPNISFRPNWNNVLLPSGSSYSTVGCSSSSPHLFETAAVPMRYIMPSPPADTTRRVSASEKLNVPPGYRFEPSDVELIVEYLLKKLMNQPLPIDIIIEENIYKFSPWDLAARHEPQEPNQWYFFTPRDKKYLNGKRPDRAAGEGFWKATGAERTIYDDNKRQVGKRNSLVFFKGKNPNSKGGKTDKNNWLKTDWLMHEYVIQNKSKTKSTSNDKRLDECVLSKVYRKVGKSDGDHSGVDVNVKEDSVKPEISQQLNMIPDNRVDDAVVENKIEPIKLAASSGMVGPLSGFEVEENDYIHALLYSDGYPEVHQNEENSLQNFQSNGYVEGMLSSRRPHLNFISTGYIEDVFTNPE